MKNLPIIQRTLRLVILVATLNLAAQEKTEPKPTSFQLEGLPLPQVEQAAVIAAELAPGDALAHYAVGSARVLRSLEVLFQDLDWHEVLQAEGVGNALRIRGIDLKRALSQPQTFDPILWIQGQGALRYVQAGEVSSQ